MLGGDRDFDYAIDGSIEFEPVSPKQEVKDVARFRMILDRKLYAK